MTQCGVPLSTYREEPAHIPEGILPTRTIANFKERLEEFVDPEDMRSGDDLYTDVHSFPIECYDAFAIPEVVKMKASTIFMFSNRELRRRFDEEPEYRIFEKIRSSLWRWGSGDIRDEWNTLVDAYNGIRNFSFELPDFEVTLTHTTGSNECGRSEHDYELFLDGVFGFMVHYRGEHVMTIGFTFAKGRKLCLTQVQMKKEKGNRFLFKLPTSAVEYALALLAKYFPTFTLHIIEGASAVEKYLGQYRNLLEQTLERQLSSERRIAEYEQERRAGKCFTNYELCAHGRELEHRAELVGEIAWVRKRILGLENEIGARIRAIYDRSHGEWLRDIGDLIAMNQLNFYRVIRA